MYNATSIANFFVKKGIESGSLLTPMQVNKLVFLSHGYCLATMDKPLIFEAVHAWKYGPVIHSVYRRFKEYGGHQIDRLLLAFHEKPEFEKLSTELEDERMLLETVWKGYGQRSGAQLSTITHRAGSPWHKVWESNGGKDQLDAVIPEAYIKEYYKALIQGV